MTGRESGRSDGVAAHHSEKVMQLSRVARLPAPLNFGRKCVPTKQNLRPNCGKPSAGVGNIEIGGYRGAEKNATKSCITFSGGCSPFMGRGRRVSVSRAKLRRCQLTFRKRLFADRRADSTASLTYRPRHPLTCLPTCLLAYCPPGTLTYVTCLPIGRLTH